MKNKCIKLNILIGVFAVLLMNEALAYDQPLAGSTPPIPAKFTGLNQTNENTDINNGKPTTTTTTATGTTTPTSPNPTPPEFVNKPLPGATPPVSVLTPPRPNP